MDPTNWSTDRPTFMAGVAKLCFPLLKRTLADHAQEPSTGQQTARTLQKFLEALLTRLFALLDRDERGAVDFSELLCALGILCRDPLKAKLSCKP
jgi:hypothetical protein